MSHQQDETSSRVYRVSPTVSRSGLSMPPFVMKNEDS